MSEDFERTSVTLPRSLLSAVDDVVERASYESRSEATRDALRAFVTDVNSQPDRSGPRSGTVVVLYEHGQGDVTEALTAVQHDFESTVVATQHVHLSHELCLESIAVDGPGDRIESLVSRLRPLTGVHQVDCTIVRADVDDRAQADE